MKFLTFFVILAAILVELSGSSPAEGGLRFERDVNDPNAYAKMTEQVGAPVDGLMARMGAPGVEYRTDAANSPTTRNTNSY